MLPNATQKRRVERWVRKWQRRIFLDGWTIETEYSTVPHEDDATEHVYAIVVPTTSHLNLSITVYPVFWTLSEEGAERRILHELVHGPTASLALMAMRSVRRKQAIKADVEHAEESLVEWMTNALWKAYR